MARKNEKVTRRKALQMIGAAGFTSGIVGTASAEEPTVGLPTGKTVPESNVKLTNQNKRGTGKAKQRPPKRPPRPKRTSSIPDSPTKQAQDRTKPDTNTNQWLAYVGDTYFNGTYGSMYADWTVPSKPDKYGDVLDPTMYYFSSLINCLGICDKRIIIQPVLQFNRFTQGEWEIAAWWVEDNNTGEHSTPITVDVGDELSGAIVKQDNGEWYIDIINKTTGEYTYLYSPNYDDRTFDKATLTLEANNYTQDQDCAKLPGQTTFSSVDLYDLNDDSQSPEWDKTKYQYLTKHPRLAVSEA